jgi:hypothetical protein
MRKHRSESFRRDDGSLTADFGVVNLAPRATVEHVSGSAIVFVDDRGQAVEAAVKVRWIAHVKAFERRRDAAHGDRGMNRLARRHGQASARPDGADGDGETTAPEPCSAQLGATEQRTAQKGDFGTSPETGLRMGELHLDASNALAVRLCVALETAPEF